MFLCLADPFHGLCSVEEACCLGRPVPCLPSLPTVPGPLLGACPDSQLPGSSSSAVTQSSSATLASTSSGTPTSPETTQPARVATKRKSSSAGQFAIATKVRRAAHLKSRASKRANKV